MDKHNHKNCRHMLDSLSEFVDGTLADELCSEIQRHLDDCPDCHLVVDTLRKTIYLYRETAQPPDVPADVRQRLYQCLDLDEYLDK